MSKAKPSRSYRRSAPPYVAPRSKTATRWPATASRAAAAIAPIPAPITAIPAMPATLSGGTDNARDGRSRGPEAAVQPAGGTAPPAVDSRFSDRRCRLRRR
ncbi:hypothetical protein GCM10010211_18800 [Streptomyces albospinus]|uniref:Uncharacterized protein n=1 Tax=Streptomyces albospinus TaxID=285515 RepID=A0ABQ2UU77_9ACTN|nr:hypothetical protein GCM10010211_18800 [Streptomyces albospinus]